MTTADIMILIYGVFYSALLIYVIDHGVHNRIQVAGYIFALIIAIIYFLFGYRGEFANLNCGFITLPLVAIPSFYLAALVSWKVSGREFRATWRGSRYYCKEKNWNDYLLSALVVIIEICWPFIVAIALSRWQG